MSEKNTTKNARPHQYEWTPEKIERVRVLWSKGVSASKIGHEVGCSKNSIVSVVRRNGFPARPSPVAPRWTADRDEIIGQMREDGRTSAEIAERLGTTRNAIIGRANRLGLPMLFNDRKVSHKKRKAPAEYQTAAKRGGGPIDGPTLPPLKSVPATQHLPKPVVVARNHTGLVGKCQYIAGSGRPWLMCGEPTLPGRAWCPHHHSVCFHPPQPRSTGNPHPTGANLLPSRLLMGWEP